MITKDMDDHITKYTQPRRLEKRGRTVAIEQLDGNKTFGTLVSHRPNIFVVQDNNDGTLREIHRATIVRFLLVINGGKSRD